MQQEDINTILAIEEATTGKRTKELEDTANFLLEHGDPHSTLVAELDGKMVGFIIGERKLWEFGVSQETGWIKSLGVYPDYQGRGVGIALGNALLEHYRSIGIKVVRTLVDWHDPLTHYFRHLGFEISSQVALELSIKED